MYGVIYKRTNLINNKVYIGQTIQNPEKRWIDEDKSMQLIGQKVREYGKENFKNEIIDFADNAEDLDKKEKFWIAYFKSNTENNGYNKTKGGKAGGPRQYGKIIAWLDKKLIFKTEIELIEYLIKLTSLTQSQIRRIIRISLRLGSYEVNNININLKLLKDCSSLEIQDFSYFC